MLVFEKPDWVRLVVVACHRKFRKVPAGIYIILSMSLGLHAGVESVVRAADQDGIDFFEAKIRPVLTERCYGCHSTSAGKAEGGLLLDNRAGMVSGGDGGSILVGNDVSTSRLLTAIRYTDESLQMPPDEPLPVETVSHFEHWLRMGAPDPRDGPATTPEQNIWDRARHHWAFQNPEVPPLPVVDWPQWPRDEIDYFVLAGLEQNGLSPAVRATPRTLVRRLYFDLIGLPPTYEQIRAFESDPSDEAWAQLVDTLLASPPFGERWARHWLDMCRYGDTKGYVFEEDRVYPNAYKFRDWVIDSINRDMPYDEFLTYQLAADAIVDPNDSEQRAHLAALGYLTLGRRFINNIHDIIDDRIDVVFRGMMALTVACARCHSHKYDPISTEDYYGIYGVFKSSREQQDDDLPLRLVDVDKPADAFVLVRGNPGSRGERVPRQFPLFFATESSKQLGLEKGSGRLDLARAITSPDNPLTARVFVNRIWSHLFGPPLVETTSDFGMRSSPPRHAALLDHLATSFVHDRWSVKRLIRRIVLSETYRQTSEVAPERHDVDNLWLGRHQRRRLDFEAFRDSLLSCSGRLDESVGGPSVRIETMPATTRRTLYAYIDRQNLPGLFRTFDFASPDAHSPRRANTTVPQQALFLLNSPFALEMAAQTAARTEAIVGIGDRVDALYHIVLGRNATALENQLARHYIEHAEDDVDPPEDPWSFGYGHMDPKDDGPDFQPLAHFTGEQWQGESKLPGPHLGWVMLRPKGGHPGNDPQHAAIRRWTSPMTGQVEVRGRLHHPAEQGDGVRGRVVLDGGRVMGEWSVHQGDATTEVESLDVVPGDHIDFVVDCRDGPAFDSFDWNVTVRSRTAPEAAPVVQWNSIKGFHGPIPPPLNDWERYAQAMMMTNEFLFVD